MTLTMQLSDTFKLTSQDRLDHIIEEIGFGRFHIMVIVGLGLRILVRGGIYSVTTILEPYFQCKFKLSYLAASFYLMSFLISFTLCTWPTGKMVDAFGKRKTMILLGVMSVVTAILHVLSSSFTMITITISAFALCEGAGFFVYPYLLEVLPKSRRKYIIIIEMFYVVGFIGGVLFCSISLKYATWHWAIVFCLIIPMIGTLIVLVWSPESPRYLIAVNDTSGAVRALAEIAVKNDPSLSKEELTEKYRLMLTTEPNVGEQTEIKVCCQGEEQAETNTLLDNTNFQLTRKEIWQRIFLVSLLRFITEFCRSIVTFGSGQSYGRSREETQCMQCSLTIELKKLISVSFGVAVAAIISYNFVGRLKRKLAFKLLSTSLAVSIIPFYFALPTLLTTGFLFISSVITGAAYMILFVYVSEIVPTSVRGLAVGLASGSSIAGLLVGAQFATYFLHLHLQISLIVTHCFVGAFLIISFFFTVETKDISLN